MPIFPLNFPEYFQALFLELLASYLSSLWPEVTEYDEPCYLGLAMKSVTFIFTLAVIKKIRKISAFLVSDLWCYMFKMWKIMPFMISWALYILLPLCFSSGFFFLNPNQIAISLSSFLFQ